MRWIVIAFMVLWPQLGFAGQVRVAVASNFAPTMAALAPLFKSETGHTAEIMAGASGAIYAQIRQGAPFDVFLSADTQRPSALVKDGLAAPVGRAPYALGAMALWVRSDVSLADTQAAAAYLKTLSKRRLAIANPRTAPYGSAAQQVLTALNLSQVQPVFGQNIGQTFALVASGNASAGFVARSQLISVTLGTVWPVPTDLHAPIAQDMVLLARAARRPAAKALFDWLQSPRARAVIAKAGYALPDMP